MSSAISFKIIYILYLFLFNNLTNLVKTSCVPSTFLHCQATTVNKKVFALMGLVLVWKERQQTNIEDTG